mmetsp:Transcript_4069/g.12241  ORF Transcript_4069/g.12241 Transcript_4069/m.12241 type:complete len:235 (+) Transcript_4069:317-1021(+)
MTPFCRNTRSSHLPGGMLKMTSSSTSFRVHTTMGQRSLRSVGKGSPLLRTMSSPLPISSRAWPTRPAPTTTMGCTLTFPAAALLPKPFGFSSSTAAAGSSVGIFSSSFSVAGAAGCASSIGFSSENLKMVDPSSALISLDTQYRSFPALARTPPCGPRFNLLTLWEDLLDPPTVWLLVLCGPKLFTFDFNNENVITHRRLAWNGTYHLAGVNHFAVGRSVGSAGGSCFVPPLWT